MSNVLLCSIVAISENRVIGKNNALPWHLPEDLKHFKKTTMGKPIIMGRKSYESLGKPLPGRANIVVSRNFKSLPEEKPTQTHQHMESVAYKVEPQSEDGPFLYISLEEGINAAKDMAQQTGKEEIFITGGGEIYKQTMGMIDRLYITKIHKIYEGDTFFPEFDWNAWNVISEDFHEGEKENDPSFTFYVLERK